MTTQTVLAECSGCGCQQHTDVSGFDCHCGESRQTITVHFMYGDRLHKCKPPEIGSSLGTLFRSLGSL